MMSAVRRAMTPLARRVMGSVGRCRVQNVDESSGRQRLQLSGLPGEVLSQVEMIGQYGLTSSPLPGALAIVHFPAGARDSGIVGGTDDSRYRPVGLAPGEVCLYNNNGAQVLMQADGSIVIVAGAAGLTIHGNEVVDGTSTVSGLGTFGDGLSVNGNVVVAGSISADGIVESVNGQTGAAVLTAADVSADAAGAAAAAYAAAVASSAQKANNLSDLTSASTARTNLGLGTVATAALVTALGTPGTNTNVPSEEAVRTAIADAVRFQSDSWAVSGVTYALTQAPNGGFILVFFDGVLQPGSAYTYAGSVLTLDGSVDLTSIATVSAIYTY